MCTSPGADSDGEERGSLQVPPALLCCVSQVWRRCGYGQVHTLPNSIPLLLHAQGHPALAAPCKGVASSPSTHTFVTIYTYLVTIYTTLSPCTHTLSPYTHTLSTSTHTLHLHIPCHHLHIPRHHLHISCHHQSRFTLLVVERQDLSCMYLSSWKALDYSYYYCSYLDVIVIVAVFLIMIISIIIVIIIIINIIVVLQPVSGIVPCICRPCAVACLHPAQLENQALAHNAAQWEASHHVRLTR